jgi:hypothetical protein
MAAMEPPFSKRDFAAFGFPIVSARNAPARVQVSAVIEAERIDRAGAGFDKVERSGAP